MMLVTEQNFMSHLTPYRTWTSSQKIYMKSMKVSNSERRKINGKPAKNGHLNNVLVLKKLRLHQQRSESRQHRQNGTSFPWMIPINLTLGLRLTCSWGERPNAKTHRSRPDNNNIFHRSALIVLTSSVTSFLIDKQTKWCQEKIDVWPKYSELKRIRG